MIMITMQALYHLRASPRRLGARSGSSGRDSDVSRLKHGVSHLFQSFFSNETGLAVFSTSYFFILRHKEVRLMQLVLLDHSGMCCPR